jgi:uncharacterized protein (DUF2384 family)
MNYPGAIRKELEQARETLDVSWKELAEIVNTRERTIYRWLKGQSDPQPSSQKKIDQMNVLLDLCNEIFKQKGKLGEWLGRKVPALRNRRPIDLIRDGRLEEVAEVLEQVAEGIPD